MKRYFAWPSLAHAQVERLVLYNEHRPRRPPLDLSSLLLGGRIVCFGMPLVPTANSWFHHHTNISIFQYPENPLLSLPFPFIPPSNSFFHYSLYLNFFPFFPMSTRTTYTATSMHTCPVSVYS